MTDSTCTGGRLTRLNFPDAIPLHRFFVPLCVFSFGNCNADDVEKQRAVCTTREKYENMVVTGKECA